MGGNAFRQHDNGLGLVKRPGHVLQHELGRLHEELITQEGQLLHSRQKLRAAIEHIARLDAIIARGAAMVNKSRVEGNICHRIATQARAIRNASLHQLLSAERKCVDAISRVNHEIKDIEAALQYQNSMGGARNTQHQGGVVDEEQEVKTIQDFLKGSNSRM